MTRILFVLSLLFSFTSHSWADPCNVVKGIKSHSEFLELVKLIKPSLEDYEMLEKCWENPGKNAGLDLGPFQNTAFLAFNNTWPENPSLADRAAAFHPYRELQIHVQNLTQKLKTVASEEIKAQAHSLASLGQEEVLAGALALVTDALEKHPYPQELSESTLRFFPKMQDVSIETKLSSIYKMSVILIAEKLITVEYVRNPQFRHPPINRDRNDVPFLSYNKFAEAIGFNLPYLSKQQQNEFLIRAVRYNPDFYEFLSPRYFSPILEAVSAASKTFSPREMNQFLTGLEKISPHERFYPEIQSKLPGLLKIAAKSQNPPAGLSLLKDKDFNQMELFFLKQKALKPLPETLSAEDASSFDWEALKSNPFGACKRILRGFTAN